MNNPRYNHVRRWLAVLLALVVVVGNLAIVFAVQVGIIA